MRVSGIRNAPQAKSMKWDMSLISIECIMGVPSLGTEAHICGWLQKKDKEYSQILASSEKSEEASWWGWTN